MRHGVWIIELISTLSHSVKPRRADLDAGLRVRGAGKEARGSRTVANRREPRACAAVHRARGFGHRARFNSRTDRAWWSRQDATPAVGVARPLPGVGPSVIRFDANQ